MIINILLIPPGSGSCEARSDPSFAYSTGRTFETMIRYHIGVSTLFVKWNYIMISFR